MILTCPECATSYFVDDSRIAAGGRTVKCSNCGARWMATPEGPQASAARKAESPPAVAPVPTTAAPDEPAADQPVETHLRPRPRPRPAPAPKREANGKVMVWAISAVVVALLIGGAIIFRAKIVQVFPASQAAYAGLGMPVSNLAIEQVRADSAFQGGRPVLAVTGQIRNLRAAPADSPALRVRLLDRLGKPVAVKIARPINSAVPAHAVRHFAISIVDPPAGAHDLDVSFDRPAKGSPRPVSVPVPSAGSSAGPQPVDAKPLPPGSPDALPQHD